MKKYASTITLLVLVLAIYWGFTSSMPSYPKDSDIPETAFSTDRALAHVKEISKRPHGVGFPGHKQVRQYLISELLKMGLETSTQKGYTIGKANNLSKATNILARIKGTDSDKSLLLLSHYDSDLHSALGASDAGSGVATILESVRAFLSANKKPKNDIIILISDGEEVDLSGAELFVDKHPWAKDVGLVLNFEARGSGGPSYVFIETNRGNQRLIEEFIEANPKYPMANSLYYSIYKMLPNDTDLTVFREKGDIEGFNFAFIGDHFDYHTARDSYERLDRNTLAHQGSYLMPLLRHFGNADLTSLKSLNDYVYFNIPFFGLVSYPFDWIWPMWGISLLVFVLLLLYGFRKKMLNGTQILKGFIPLILTLTINGVIGFYSWSVLKWMYPHYQDILQGFTYNGYTYIAVFVFFSIGSCFWVYHKFKKLDTANLLIAPIALWLIICWGVSRYLQGAAFFIVPVFAVLASLLVTLDQKKSNSYILLLLTLPGIWIYAPFIKGFPVGLGLKMMVSATILTTLTFFLMLPLFGINPKKKQLAFLSLVLSLGFMIAAHLNSGFDKENPKPTSLLYVMDADDGTAQWATYENELSDWTAQYLGANKKTTNEQAQQTISSKYSSGFTYVSPAPIKDISPPQIEKTRDTIIGEKRILDIRITPQRNVNRLEVFTNDIPISEVSLNRIALSDYELKNRKRSRLATHHITDNDTTELTLSIPKNAVLELTLYEASNDLLENEQFTVPARPEDNIPMPFVLNDAILVIKKIRFE
ncbi:M28 family peptidase [Ulvibacterium marinum]|uniref:Vacuolar membrane protease n=1 Tax=Ulvibacterium marinum TaxID=2419782 RepID=A0A3B0C9T9_9FLAO|nr:M28 family peptidase [Ulvibacterium marinum]RKN82433.1 M28 family peptidase [Ulvibacterium marinum]